METDWNLWKDLRTIEDHWQLCEVNSSDADLGERRKQRDRWRVGASESRSDDTENPYRVISEWTRSGPWDGLPSSSVSKLPLSQVLVCALLCLAFWQYIIYKHQSILSLFEEISGWDQFVVKDWLSCLAFLGVTSVFFNCSQCLQPSVCWAWLESLEKLS